MRLNSKFWKGILVGSVLLGMTACDMEKPKKINRISRDARSIFDDSNATMDSIKRITTAYIETTSKDIKTISDSSLEKVVFDTYRKGHKEKGLLIEDLTEAIRYTNELSDDDKSLVDINRFVSEIIDLTSKYNITEIFELLEAFNEVVDSDEPIENFVETTIYVLERCKAKSIKPRDFAKLVTLVDELDNDDRESIKDYEDLMILTETAMDKYNVKIEVILDITTLLDDNCDYFNHDTVIGINEGLFHMAHLYRISGMSWNAFISKLENISSKRCYRISDFVERMKNLIEKNQQKQVSLNNPDDSRVREKTKEINKPVKAAINIPSPQQAEISFDPENYRPIALGQYANDTHSFDGKKVMIAAVPITQTKDNELYVLKIEDEKDMLDCFFYGKTGLELVLTQNDVKHVVGLNEKADTKKKIIIYGTLKDDMLMLDAVNAGYKVRRLR